MFCKFKIHTCSGEYLTDFVGGFFLSLAKLCGNSRDKYLICGIVKFSRGRKPFFSYRQLKEINIYFCLEIIIIGFLHHRLVKLESVYKVMFIHLIF